MSLTAELSNESSNPFHHPHGVSLPHPCGFWAQPPSSLIGPQDAYHKTFSKLSNCEQTDDGGQAMLDTMQSATKTKLSMENVLRAEAELLDYIQSGSGNPQKQKQLAMAVQSAIDESVGPLAEPCPTRWKSQPLFRPTHDWGRTQLQLTPSAKAASLKSQPWRNRTCSKGLASRTHRERTGS